MFWSIRKACCCTASSPLPPIGKDWENLNRNALAFFKLKREIPHATRRDEGIFFNCENLMQFNLGQK